jgi:predicted dehydrogenase/nucleoside-diphosphate-sugar epimerase
MQNFQVRQSVSNIADRDKRAPGAERVRVGIVGAGFISDFHAKAIRAMGGAELCGVADSNQRNAESFASRWTVPAIFPSLDAMLASHAVDAVHLLVPPDQHYPLARIALDAGVHVFLEKPMCTSVSEADELMQLAKTKGLHLGVNHNFLFSAAYQKLRNIVKSGTLGPLSHLHLGYLFEMPQIRLGPFDTWMLSEPGHLLLETGPHLFSAVLDIVGQPDRPSVIADREVTLPGGLKAFRRWRIRSTAGPADLSIDINFAPGFPQRTISVRGLFGSASADLDSDTCLVDLATPSDPDVDRYTRSMRLARQLRGQARRTLLSYVAGKLNLSNRSNPFQSSIVDSVAAFYAAVRNSAPLDERIGAERGSDVIRLCFDAIQAADLGTAVVARQPTRARPAVDPTVLLLGGSGFIGRELIRQLLSSGYAVRAMIRGSSVVLDEMANDRLEIVRGDVRNEADLRSAMSGIKFVYHLAHAPAKTWQEYLEKDVAPTQLIGGLCLEMKVKRLVYTGTISSYYAGAAAGTITEQTALDPKIQRRDYYSRAKAAAEGQLMEMFRTRKLPVVIFRPGIVVGEGGNPLHWGVGRFTQNICEVWGDGSNPLPLVLNSDVAGALVRGIEVGGIEGKSFNLVDLPLISAHDYLDELQRRTGLTLSVIYRPIWEFYLSDVLKWAVKVAVRHPDRVRIPSYADWETRTQKAVFDCSQTRNVLGWQPASNRQRILKEGIDDAVDAWLAAMR